MCDGDFDPPGWGPDREEGDVEGNAGCGCAMIVIVILGIIGTLIGK